MSRWPVWASVVPRAGTIHAQTFGGTRAVTAVRDFGVIVVVEGPSAAGKSTWSARWSANQVVAEHGSIVPPPDLSANETVQFWTDMNCTRWRRATAIEWSGAVAICDTDPLKLHYDYGLARMGAVSWADFVVRARHCERAISEQRLGIADVILVAIPDDSTLERHRRHDATRVRRHFARHRRLGPAIRDWYQTLDHLDPGRVAWGFPDHLPELVDRSHHDLALFTSWMATLPRDTM